MPGSRRALAAALAGCAILAWLGCARTPVGDGTGAASERDAPAARPGPAPGQVPVALPDAGVTALAEARSVRFEPDPSLPGQSVAHFDIGVENPAVCSFAPRADTRAMSAHLLTAVVAGAMQSFSPDAAPEIASRVRAGALGRAPFLSLDVAMGRDDRGLLVLQRLATRDGRVVHCVLVAADASGSLDRLFASLVRTLAVDPAPPAPVHGFLLTVHLDGEPAGVIEVVTVEEEDGVLRTERRSALLMPTRDGGRAPLDHLDVERTRRDGALLSAHNEHHEAFASQLELTLEPAGRQAWRVHGTLGPRPVDEIFSAPAPTSYLRYLRDVRDAARARQLGVPVRERAWSPNLSVGGFIEGVTVLEESETGGLVGVERLGSVVYTFAIDADGLPDSGWLERGPVRIEQRRETVFGEVPEP